jgi:hypothetical protein
VPSGVVSSDVERYWKGGARSVEIVSVDGEKVTETAIEILPGVHRIEVEAKWSNGWKDNALRPSRPVQRWDFCQAEKELTTLPVLRYDSGRRKGGLKILSMSNQVSRRTMSKVPETFRSASKSSTG